jgi:dTDP-4-dehydrorhamnose reductase
MKVIIFGANGMLGSYLYRFLIGKNMAVIRYGRRDLDIFEGFQEKTLLDRLKILVNEDDWVVNCAGITNKRPDVDVAQMYVVNSIFPMFLDSLGVRVIHISTDCVFNGDKGLYTVSDFPNATDDYGMSKSFGERLQRTCVIRTSIIGSTEQKREHLPLLEWAKSKKDGNVNGFINHMWNGVTCLELAKIIHAYWLRPNSGYANFNKTGCIINVTSRDSVSKAELLRQISHVYNLALHVTPVEAKKNDKRLIGTIVSPRTIREQLIELKEFDTPPVRRNVVSWRDPGPNWGWGDPRAGGDGPTPV